MIDFRYHLVSIIAIFLALALGIVFGTTALNGGIVTNLKRSQNQIIKEKRGLEDSVRDLRNQVARREDFTTTVAGRVLAGRLPGERVLFVVTPDASTDTVKDLEELVVRAGGAPMGVLRLRDDLLDPSKSQLIDDTVASVAPAGVALPEGTPADKAAVELAAALVVKGGGTGLSDEAAAKVLGGFRAAELVEMQPPAGAKAPADPTEPATMVVLVTGGSNGEPQDEVGQQRQRTVLAVARALDDRSDGVVVTGPDSSADPGGLVQALRADNELSDRVSSVDAADTAFGQVTVVLALDEQNAGRSGRYGQGPGSQAAAPQPVS